MTDVLTGLFAVTVHVREIEKARRFYRDVLGLSEIETSAPASRAVFAVPGTTTRLSMHVMAPNEEGREPGTVSGLIFSHPFPGVACAEIERRGGTVTVAPTLVERGPVKFYRAVIADPDGNEFVISSQTD